MYKITRTDKEIDDVMNKAAESEEAGTSRWRGMTYEQGVKQALGWVIGDYEDNPMDE